MAPLISDAALSKALDILVQREPKFQPVLDEIGTVPLRRAQPGFEGLAQIITGQQVSKAAASAIWDRLKQEMPVMDAHNMAHGDDEPLIKAGLSRPKQRTMRALAQHILDTQMDLAALVDEPADQAIAKLVEIKGVGPWTAECFLLFCGGHPDVFPAGDIALQQAACEIFNMRGRPNDKKLRERAKKWRPVRAAAARILWAHYNFHRGMAVEAVGD